MKEFIITARQRARIVDILNKLEAEPAPTQDMTQQANIEVMGVLFEVKAK